MRISRKSRICLAVTAVVVLAGAFWPWLAAQGEYLWHRQGVLYRGKVVPMPRGWMVTVPSWDAGPDLSFTRWLTCGFCVRHPAWAYMSFGRETMPHKSPQDDLQGLGEGLRAEADLFRSDPITGGMVVVGPYAVRAHAGDAWCYTASFPLTRTEDITCLLFNAEWRGEYSGPREHAKDFFRVVEGIREAKSK